MSNFPELVPPWTKLPLIHEDTGRFPEPTMDVLSATIVAELEEGTGWVNLSSYFLDASVEGRRVGPHIEIRGQIETDVPLGTGSMIINAISLPTMFRPASRPAIGVATSGGNVMACFITPSGSMSVSNRNHINITAWLASKGEPHGRPHRTRRRQSRPAAHRRTHRARAPREPRLDPARNR